MATPKIVYFVRTMVDGPSSSTTFTRGSHFPIFCAKYVHKYEPEDSQADSLHKQGERQGAWEVVMIRKLLTLGVTAGLFAAVTPASGAVVLYCSSGPGIDLVNNGCVSGTANDYPGGGDGVYSNSGGGDPLAAVQAAITSATGVAPVGLSLYGKSDSNAGLFALSGVSPAALSGTWNVLDDSILIKYITVKAANSFALYELSGQGANSGVFTTLGLLNNGGNRPKVSHISFWQTAAPAVPEPATWAMMIFGFAGIGISMRRRNKDASLSLA